jgi:hypothetical protein
MEFSVGQLLTKGDFSSPDFFAFITKIHWDDYYQQQIYTIQYFKHFNGRELIEQIRHEQLLTHLEEMLP